MADMYKRGPDALAHRKPPGSDSWLTRDQYIRIVIDVYKSPRPAVSRPTHGRTSSSTSTSARSTRWRSATGPRVQPAPTAHRDQGAKDVRPDENGAVLSYSLAPKKIVLALPVAAIATFSLLAASLAAGPHLGGDGPLQPIVDAVARHEVPLLLFVIASSMVVLRFIDDAYLRGGLLWLYFVPVGLALLSLVP